MTQKIKKLKIITEMLTSYVFSFTKTYLWLIIHPRRAVLMKQLHDAHSEAMLKNIKTEIKRRKANNSDHHDHDL